MYTQESHQYAYIHTCMCTYKYTWIQCTCTCMLTHIHTHTHQPEPPCFDRFQHHLSFSNAKGKRGAVQMKARTRPSAELSSVPGTWWQEENCRGHRELTESQGRLSSPAKHSGALLAFLARLFHRLSLQISTDKCEECFILPSWKRPHLLHAWGPRSE